MIEKIFNLFLPFLYFTPILRHNFTCRRNLLLPLYNSKNVKDCSMNDGCKTIVYMVQSETTFSGGLSDRLRGIISIYAECKRQRLPFKIVFEPLHLQDYLVPNQYDWQLNTDEILTYHHNLRNCFQRFAQRMILRYYLKKHYKQIHIYSNMAIADKEFSTLFKELFRPSERLQNQIDYHLSQLGGAKKYISLTFRFRQLLGDFKEGGEVLPESEREAYVLRCIKGIEELHAEFPSERLLVTSDSKMFLDRLSYLDYVYVIPGNVVHMGFTFDASQDVYMKSFVDYYMLSNAKTVFQMTDKLLFRSGFPKRAAMLNGAKYVEISL